MDCGCPTLVENERGQTARELAGSKGRVYFYQPLVGAWPLSLDRAIAYMQKAAREANEHTNWRKPVPAYEEALREFVIGAFNDSRFMADVEEFVSRLLDGAWVNSLAQTLVKLTAPGVPDIYQGGELWDLSLADPDNRRPVDFACRKRVLTEVKSFSAEEAWQQRATGAPNMWLIWKSLELRRRRPECFGPAGGYDPLRVQGARATNVVAFMRGGAAVTVVPRLTLGIDDGWADTTVELPPGRWRNILTLQPVSSGRMTELVEHFPVALLLLEEG